LRINELHRIKDYFLIRNPKFFMLSILTTALLAMHLLAMHLASAGPLLCLGLCRGRREPESLAQRLGARLAWLSMLALLFGSGVGLVMLFAGPSAGMLQAIDRFPVRATWYAGAELLFSLVCLWIYWLGCRANGWCKTALGRWTNGGIAMLSITNLLYHFPPLMVVLAKLSSAPSWVEAEIIDRPLFLQLMFQGEVLSHSLHFCLAALAVAALAVLWLLSKQEQVGEDDPQWKHIARRAAGVGLVASLLQIPVGVWVLMTLPSRTLQPLLGGSSLGSMLLLVGILSAMLLIQRLAVIAMGETGRADLKRACRQLLLVILLMTAVSCGL